MSTRETILNNLATQLATITTDNSYQSEVNEVYHDGMLSSDSITEGVDFNVVDPGRDTIRQYCDGGIVRTSMEIQIEAFTRGMLNTAMKSENDKIIADVRKLVHTAIALGASACFTQIIGVPEVYIEEQTAIVRFDLRIDYVYDGASP